MTTHDIIDRIINVVVAYIAHNRISVSELPSLIQKTHNTLVTVIGDSIKDELLTLNLTKKQISDTIKSEYLVSFIDGRKYKTLKRHLKSHGLTPNRYKAKYDLPDDYPMVAPGYSIVRSRIAKDIKLGQKVV